MSHTAQKIPTPPKKKRINLFNPQNMTAPRPGVERPQQPSGKRTEWENFTIAPQEKKGSLQAGKQIYLFDGL